MMSEIKTLAKELQDYTRVVGSHNKHIQSVANRLVELTEQPQLNEDQQVVLEYLKYRFGKYDDVFVRSIFSPIDDLISECWDDELNTAFEQLDLKQEIQVLEVFGQWALEQEELND